MRLLIEKKDLELLLEKKRDFIGNKVTFDTVIAGISFLLSTFTATYEDILGIPGKIIKIIFCLIGIIYAIKIIKDIYEMHKNKYDHNILLNDIQKLDKIQHKHSLVAIQFPDTSAEKKYLVYYDERWDCKLFLNYKTVDRADEESVINKVSADLNVDKSQINCRYISSKVQEKYSESHQENRIYNHRLYEIKIQVFPEDEQKENFVVNGRHYYWMSISDMERDPNIVKKNLDVIDFVKESMHA
mgnify:CR=1 FL=1